MPAYHSAYNDDPDARIAASMSLLPIRSRIRGPAPQPVDPSAMDIVDEAIDLFRANSLFRNFEIKGPADRVGAMVSVGREVAACACAAAAIGWRDEPPTP